MGRFAENPWQAKTRTCVAAVPRIDLRPHVTDGDTVPAGVELRPLRHAVDVRLEHGARHPRELFPRPAPDLGNESVDGEVPFGEVDIRDHSGWRTRNRSVTY